jgi:hypothetical protein
MTQSSNDPSSDYELQKAPEELPPAESRAESPIKWLIIVGLVISLGGAAYFVGRRAPESSTATTTAPASETTAPPEARPLGGLPESIDVPALDQSDAIVRELVRRLSAHPKVAAWLTTDNLIRGFTASVLNVAEGRTPAAHLRVLRPSSSFRVIEEGESTYLDPRSYTRYNELAAAVESIDADGAARLYATLKPRIEEAYRDLGQPDLPFDRTLQQAIVQLLETPIPRGDIALRESSKGIGYVFEDDTLENLTVAQRQFIRMGPENMRRVKASLRRIAIALGIPEAQLPSPS